MVVELREVTGDPAVVLVDIAREVAADLLVIGRRGGDFVARTLLGSVAQRAVQHAPCDVLGRDVPGPWHGQLAVADALGSSELIDPGRPNALGRLLKMSSGGQTDRAPGVSVADVASSCPRESCACTVTSPALVNAFAAVSKPVPAAGWGGESATFSGVISSGRFDSTAPPSFSHLSIASITVRPHSRAVAAASVWRR